MNMNHPPVGTMEHRLIIDRVISQDPQHGVALRFVFENLYLRTQNSYKQILQAGVNGLLRQFLNVRKSKNIFGEEGNEMFSNVAETWMGMDSEATYAETVRTLQTMDVLVDSQNQSTDTVAVLNFVVFDKKSDWNDQKKLTNHEKDLFASKIAMAFFLILVENSGSAYIEEMTEPCETNQASGFPEYDNPGWWHRYHKQRYMFRQTLDDELPPEQLSGVKKSIENYYDVPF